MNVLIILGHPNNSSFNHAIAETCKAQIIKNGHCVVFHDLYKEKFNPVSEIVDQFKDNKIDMYCSDLVNSDGVIIIHPNWWGQPPAIVKGWLDRVFLPEVAYTFVKDAEGKFVQKGLLKAQFAIVLNTSNTSEELEEKIFKDPLETIWGNRVFKFCGIHNYKRVNFQVMKDSDFKQRTDWLCEIRQLIDIYLPKV
ncbi:MAG: NAD(P)H-dependent oxidoreductase [Bacteroidales bacterium]